MAMIDETMTGELTFDTTRLIPIAQQAGRAIMAIYQSGGLSISRKSDDSPVTEADTKAHAIILRALKAYSPGTPIISEESYDGTPITAREYWLVDPLDGTREFINKSREFTINIAYIRAHVPIFGIVYAPAQEKLYYGVRDKAFIMEKGKEHAICGREKNSQGVSICVSLNHDNADAVRDFWHKRFKTPIKEIISMGSSLKFCSVAAGEADVYLRLVGSHGWDTAAGDAIVRAAGGRVLTLDGEPLAYGENSLNGAFMALNEDLRWQFASGHL